MKLYVAGPQGLNILESEPWISLIRGLAVHHEIVNSLDAAEAFVSVNHQPEILKRASRLGISPQRRALIMLEPAATLPAHGSARRMSSYAHIFCGSPYWANAVGGQAFTWPQELAPSCPPVDLTGEFSFIGTMVAGQKRSAMRSSLYGLRRDVLRSLGETRIPVGLAGANWYESHVQRWNRAGRSLVKAGIVDPAKISLSQALGRVELQGVDYVGPVEDKLQFMRRAPVAIVIENSLDYVSEKLVDAIRAGVAPIYVGPPLVDFDLPPGVAISVDPRARDVVKRLSGISAAELEDCIAQGQLWLGSEDSQWHDSRRVMRSLGERLGQSLALQQL